MLCSPAPIWQLARMGATAMRRGARQGWVQPKKHPPWRKAFAQKARRIPERVLRAWVKNGTNRKLLAEWGEPGQSLPGSAVKGGQGG
jgi:hypothetical protein